MSIAARLIRGLAHHCVRCRIGVHESNRLSCVLLLNSRSLDWRLACANKLFLPARLYLGRVLLMNQERTLYLLVCIPVFNAAVQEADIYIDSWLPQRTRLLALGAGHGSLLQFVLVSQSRQGCIAVA